MSGYTHNHEGDMVSKHKDKWMHTRMKGWMQTVANEYVDKTHTRTHTRLPWFETHRQRRRWIV